MKRINGLIALAASMVILCSAQVPQVRHLERAKEQIVAAYAGYVKACLAHDVKGALSYFTKDVVFQYPNRAVTGKRLKDGMTKYVLSLKRDSKLWFTVGTVSPTGPKTVVADTTLHFVGTVAGKPVRTTTRCLETWVKTPQGWKNSLGIMSPSVPE